MIVGLVLSRTVHDINFAAVLYASAILYAPVTYLCLRVFHKP